jgi:recombination protein RecT
MSNEIIAQQKVGITTFLSSDKVRANIMQVVGQKSTTRFIASVVSAVQNTPALQECSNNSILSAALLGEALNLSPSPQLGQFYMVPYKKKDRNGQVVSVDAQFQLGAKGYKQLAMRTGQYKDLDVIYIRQGEYLGRDRSTGKHKFEFIEDDAVREELPVIGYLAYFELLNGFRKEIFWTKAKMEKHANQYSQAFDLDTYHLFLEGKIPKKDLWRCSSFWYKSFDEMAEKTMIRQLISKWGIMSIEMTDAYERDMAVISEDGSPRYIDNEAVNQHEEDLSQANTIDFEEPEMVSNEVVEQTGGDPF